MVKRIPLIFKLGFKFILILSIVFTSCDIPSRAKNSVCSGTNNSSATTNDITVNKLNEGGQSIKIFSYLENKL